jgi:hypothetical protein
MYDYYRARYCIVTARRAQIMGIRTSRSYGYYVLIDPPMRSAGKLPGSERVRCWCRSKAGAMEAVEYNRRCQRLGFHCCPCGSQKQARNCCGIPGGAKP